jgi:BirA family biotin operon repressor/biotin-[acetyl-CoA-carboxylase] ligase
VDPSAEERVRKALQQRGQLWSAPIEHFETLPSTNDWLKQRARQGFPDWSVVLADQQTAGRGRQGHSWLSPPGNLCLSVLLPPSGEPVLTLAAGVAIVEAVRVFGVAAELKWPNDVLVGGRKLAGLLAESVSGGAELEGVVLGVGVNVRLDPASLPPEIASETTSIRRETGRDADPLALAAEVLARLSVWYHALARDGAAAILDAWRARSVPWWGKPVEVVSGSERVRGVVRDVDARGALLVETETGLTTILSGEARALRPR